MSGALGSMIRLHRWMLDEKRRNLADLQVFAEKLREDLGQLDSEMEAQKAAAEVGNEAGLAYSSYVSAALERRKKVEGTITNLEVEIEAAREDVAESFRELKRYEAAQEGQRAKAKADRNRRERINQDELAVGLYRRSRGQG